MMAEYIEREAFLEHMKSTNRYFDVKFDVEEFPAADVAPVVHGKWIPESDDDQDEGEFCCSLCFAPEFFPNGVPLSRYCYNCGAKMDGGDNHA